MKLQKYFKINNSKLDDRDLLNRQTTCAIVRMCKQNNIYSFVTDIRVGTMGDDFVNDKATLSISLMYGEELVEQCKTNYKDK